MTKAVDLNKIYYALAPDFMQKRNGKTLLIWSFLPYWMVVSDQLLKLLTCFNGQRTLVEIIESTVNLSDIPRAKYEFIVKRKVSDLLKAKILSDKPEKFVASKPNTENAATIDELTIALSDESIDETILTVDELKTFIRNTYKYLTNTSMFKIVASKPITDTSKLVTIVKTAIFKGLNIVLDIPPESYTEDLIKELAKTRAQVQVTFDGTGPEMNDIMQGEGAYNKNIEAINNLVAKKIYTILNVNCSEHNYDEVEGFLRLARSLKVNECRIVPLRKIGRYKDYRVPDYREITTGLTKAIKKDPEYIKILGRDLFSVFEQLITCNEKKSSCGTGIRHMFLGADGNIYPCIGFKLNEFSAGNVKTESLEDIWELSKPLNEIRKKCSVDQSYQCMRCIIRYWCRGGCYSEKLINSGKVDSSSLACKSIQMAFIDMFWLLADAEETIKPKQSYCL